jgi:predicted small lipoprotein YifL
MTTTRSPRVHALAAALFALTVAACGSSTPTQAPPTATAAPSVQATHAPATPPASANPGSSPTAALCNDSATGAPAASSDANDPNAAVYSEIESQVQQLRGITATTPVARGVFDQQGLCAYLRTSFHEQNPESLVKATETLYKQLLLMPQDASLEQLYLDMLTSQVAGLYDDKTKHMYVVSTDGGIGPAEEITYAHEFTHALQDQKFVLKTVVGDALDQGDRTLARSALVEGDATLLMSVWAQQNLSASELGTVAGSVDPASQAVLDAMPAILKDPLLFPYTSGLNLVIGGFTSGGFGAVDALYAKPPDSTEQVLHADKLASREAPVVVSFPDGMASRLGDGWKVSMQDTLGEFQLGTILKEGGATAPLDAAAGWGGDRVALLEGPDGKVAVVLDTAWDTAADADQFATAIDSTVAKLNAAGRSASVLRPSANQVVLISAESADTMGRVANVLGLAG